MHLLLNTRILVVCSGFQRIPYIREYNNNVASTDFMFQLVYDGSGKSVAPFNHRALFSVYPLILAGISHLDARCCAAIPRLSQISSFLLVGWFTCASAAATII